MLYRQITAVAARVELTITAILGELVQLSTLEIRPTMPPHYAV